MKFKTVVLAPNPKKSTGRSFEKRKRSSCERMITVKCGHHGENCYRTCKQYRTCTHYIILDLRRESKGL